MRESFTNYRCFKLVEFPQNWVYFLYQLRTKVFISLLVQESDPRMQYWGRNVLFIISTIMSLNRALYEGACFKVGLLGGTEVECWLFTAGCRLQFWKDHFRQWVIFEILHSITYKVSQKNIALALLVWPLHITLLCKIAHLSEMTILKIVSGSPLCVTSLSQCHLAGRFWNIHNTHNSI